MTKTKKPASVTEATYTDATDNYMGWCTECRDFTRECSEPDARHYDCPKCGGSSVFGAEQALLEGMITLKAGGYLE